MSLEGTSFDLPDKKDYIEEEIPSEVEGTAFDLAPKEVEEEVTPDPRQQRIPTTQEILKGTLGLAEEYITEGAKTWVGSVAGATKGIIDVIDIPLELASAASQVIGGSRLPTLKDAPYVEQATTPVPVDNPVAPYLYRASEFASGGLTMSSAARKSIGYLEKEIVNNSESILKGLTREMAKTPARTEYVTSIGAGTGAQVAEEMGGDEIAQMFGAMAGGMILGVPDDMIRLAQKYNPFSKEAAKSRASKTIKAHAENLEEAHKALIHNDIDHISAMEATQDLGLMSLQKSILAEEAVASGDYHAFYKTANEMLQKEFKEVLGNNERLTPGLVQNYLLRHNEQIMKNFDDRVDQMVSQVADMSKLYKGQASGTDLSVKFSEALRRAQKDIKSQEQVLWNSVDKNVAVDTSPLKEAALAIVSKEGKYADLPTKELELIIGRTIQKAEGTTPGLSLGKITKEKGISNQVSMNDLMSLRTTLLSEIRDAYAGQKVNRKKGAVLEELNRAIMKAIEENPLADQYNAEMYKMATSFTRRFHDVFSEGLIGKLSRKDFAGGDVVSQEMALKNLLKGTPETQATGSRELDKLIQMASESGAPTMGVTANIHKYIAQEFGTTVDTYGEALDFMAKNHAKLKKFPLVRREIEAATEKMRIAEEGIGRVKAKRSAIEALTFQRITGMNGVDAVNHIKSTPNPLKSAKRLKHILRGNPEAIAGFKNDVSEYLIKNTFEGTKLPGVDEVFNKQYLHRQLNNPGMKAVLDTWYTKDEVKRLNKVLEAVTAHTTSAASPTRKIKLTATPIFEVLSRVSMTRLGSAMFGSQDTGISMQQAAIASTFGKWLARTVPIGHDMDLLRSAIRDEEVLKALMTYNANPYDPKIYGAISKVMAMSGQDVLEEFERKSEEYRQEQLQEQATQ